MFVHYHAISTTCEVCKLNHLKRISHQVQIFFFGMFSFLVLLFLQSIFPFNGDKDKFKIYTTYLKVTSLTDASFLIPKRHDQHLSFHLFVPSCSISFFKPQAPSLRNRGKWRIVLLLTLQTCSLNRSQLKEEHFFVHPRIFFV